MRWEWGCLNDSMLRHPIIISLHLIEAFNTTIVRWLYSISWLTSDHHQPLTSLATKHIECSCCLKVVEYLAFRRFLAIFRVKNFPVKFVKILQFLQSFEIHQLRFASKTLKSTNPHLAKNASSRYLKHWLDNTFLLLK